MRAVGKDKEKEHRPRKKPGRVPTSCAECRRLKLKCDRNVPCQECVSRGCGSICPDGALTPGKNNRMISANTAELHDRIDHLTSRIRELEGAFQSSQAQVSDQPHPLLQKDSFQAVPPLPSPSRPSSSSTDPPLKAEERARSGSRRPSNGGGSSSGSTLTGGSSDGLPGGGARPSVGVLPSPEMLSATFTSGGLSPLTDPRTGQPLFALLPQPGPGPPQIPPPPASFPMQNHPIGGASQPNQLPTHTPVTEYPIDQTALGDRVPFMLRSQRMAAFVATLSPEQQEALEVQIAQQRAALRLQDKRKVRQMADNVGAYATDEHLDYLI